MGIRKPDTFSRYDTADYLTSDEDMVAYLDACVEEASDDPAFIAASLGNIARARGMIGVTRQSLIKLWLADRCEIRQSELGQVCRWPSGAVLRRSIASLRRC